jgi:tRNA(Ile)-lysidine synthase TilS/MesJ
MNYSNDYQRSKIRNVLIPLLEKEFNPKTSKSLAKLGDLVQKYQKD